MRMAPIFSKGSMRWILMFIFGLSVMTFSLLGLYTVAQHQTVAPEHDRHFVGRRGRILIDDIPSLQSDIQQVHKALRSTEIERMKISLKNTTKTNNQKIKKMMPGKHEEKGPTFASLYKNSTLNFNVHIFYYPWYKSEQVDGKYVHWNHEVIPDWHKPASLNRKRQYVPPGEIGANFYPKLGPYSSHDPKVIEVHMQQMRSMGTGVVCVSWYPPQYLKDSETHVDDLMLALFDMAAKYGVKITFHIEPFEHRSGKTLQEVSKYIIDKYGNHSAFYRTDFNGRKLPVYYVYDSYQIEAKSWAEALKPSGGYTVRNTPYDAIFLGLMVENTHMNHLSQSGFDGFYTYFAANGFTYGSSWINWDKIAADSKAKGLIFVPSIGPGYLDTRVRPWNKKNSRLRLNGKYYRKSFYNALSVRPHFLSVTSYNEWHEGTQVEPAVPKVHDGFKYVDYTPNAPEFYLNLTRQFVSEYTHNMSTILMSHQHDDSF